MKRQSQTDKIEKKRRLWVERTAQILRVSEQEAIELLSIKRQQSIRINPLVAGTEGFEPSNMGTESIPWDGKQYPWMPDGYTVEGDITWLRDSELVTSGCLFIQNAASWLPVLALDPRADETILDVCAAPGGKTSHIAAITNNRAYITANDNSRPRLAKLQANMKRLGADISRYTLFDATQLARKLEDQQYRKILLDAPCSGEGLMRLDDNKMLATWSAAHIKRLQQLQKRLLVQSWQLLRPDGTLVYSTCTMAPEENEAVIDYLLRTHDDARIVPFEIDVPNRVPPVQTWNNRSYNTAIQGCLRLKPSKHIEAFFVCKLQKVN